MRWQLPPPGGVCPALPPPDGPLAFWLGTAPSGGDPTPPAPESRKHNFPLAWREKERLEPTEGVFIF